MIRAGLHVILHSTGSLQVTTTCVATDVMKRRSYISMELAQITARFLTNIDINGIEISAIILVFTVGISIGMVLVNPTAITLLKHPIKTDNTTVIIPARNMLANTFISTKVASILVSALIFQEMNPISFTVTSLVETPSCTGIIIATPLALLL